MSTSKDSSSPIHAPPTPKPPLKDPIWGPVPSEVQARIQQFRPNAPIWAPLLSDLEKRSGSLFQGLTNADSSAGKELPSAGAPASRTPSTSPSVKAEKPDAEADADEYAKAAADKIARTTRQLELVEQNKKARAGKLQPPLPFVLPNITLASFRATSDRLLAEAGRATYFSPRVIVWALQNKQPVQDIWSYINQFPADFVRVEINKPIFCLKLGIAVPILFFAVEHGSLDVIRKLVTAGADLEARNSRWQIPLLAYTVLHSDIDKIDTTEIFKLLLALGANPNQIPEDIWTSYIDSPKSE